MASMSQGALGGQYYKSLVEHFQITGISTVILSGRVLCTDQGNFEIHRTSWGFSSGFYRLVCVPKLVEPIVKAV